MIFHLILLITRVNVLVALLKSLALLQENLLSFYCMCYAFEATILG